MDSIFGDSLKPKAANTSEESLAEVSNASGSNVEIIYEEEEAPEPWQKRASVYGKDLPSPASEDDLMSERSGRNSSGLVPSPLLRLKVPAEDNFMGGRRSPVPAADHSSRSERCSKSLMSDRAETATSGLADDNAMASTDVPARNQEKDSRAQIKDRDLWLATSSNEDVLSSDVSELSQNAVIPVAKVHSNAKAIRALSVVGQVEDGDLEPHNLIYSQENALASETMGVAVEHQKEMAKDAQGNPIDGVEPPTLPTSADSLNEDELVKPEVAGPRVSDIVKEFERTGQVEPVDGYQNNVHEGTDEAAQPAQPSSLWASAAGIPVIGGAVAALASQLDNQAQSSAKTENVRESGKIDAENAQESVKVDAENVRESAKVDAENVRESAKVDAENGRESVKVDGKNVLNKPQLVLEPLEAENEAENAAPRRMYRRAMSPGSFDDLSFVSGQDSKTEENSVEPSEANPAQTEQEMATIEATSAEEHDKTSLPVEIFNDSASIQDREGQNIESSELSAANQDSFNPIEPEGLIIAQDLNPKDTRESILDERNILEMKTEDSEPEGHGAESIELSQPEARETVLAEETVLETKETVSAGESEFKQEDNGNTEESEATSHDYAIDASYDENEGLDHEFDQEMSSPKVESHSNIGDRNETRTSDIADTVPLDAEGFMVQPQSGPRSLEKSEVAESTKESFETSLAGSDDRNVLEALHLSPLIDERSQTLVANGKVSMADLEKLRKRYRRAKDILKELEEIITEMEIDLEELAVANINSTNS